MRVLVIGSEGNMGRRYCAILKYLGVEWVGIDLPVPADWLSWDWDRAIITTPTDTHVDIIGMMDDRPWMCEKPITKQIGLMGEIARKYPNGRMVCNYIFAGIPNQRDNLIEYSFYNTGKDGLCWDLIQLIYLSETLGINNTAPIFSLTCNGKKITLDNICLSYCIMIEEWLKNQYLWDMGDALRATKAVIDYEKMYYLQDNKGRIRV